MTNVFVQERFPIYFQIFEITAQACWPEKNSKTGRKIDLQNLMYFYAFTQRNLNIRTTTLDCPSKIKVANKSLAVVEVEAVTFLLILVCTLNLFYKHHSD